MSTAIQGIMVGASIRHRAIKVVVDAAIIEAVARRPNHQPVAIVPLAEWQAAQAELNRRLTLNLEQTATLARVEALRNGLAKQDANQIPNYYPPSWFVERLDIALRGDKTP